MDIAQTAPNLGAVFVSGLVVLMATLRVYEDSGLAFWIDAKPYTYPKTSDHNHLAAANEARTMNIRPCFSAVLRSISRYVL